MFVVAALPDGRPTSGSRDKTVRIWDVETSKCVRVLGGHGGNVYGVATLPDGRLASCSFDKTVRIWDVDTGECVQVPTGHGHYLIGSGGTA